MPKMYAKELNVGEQTQCKSEYDTLEQMTPQTHIIALETPKLGWLCLFVHYKTNLEAWVDYTGSFRKMFSSLKGTKWVTIKNRIIKKIG